MKKYYFVLIPTIAVMVGLCLLSLCKIPKERISLSEPFKEKILPEPVEAHSPKVIPIVQSTDNRTSENRLRARIESCFKSVSKICNYFDVKTIKEIRKEQKIYSACKEKHPDGFWYDFDEYGARKYKDCGKKPPPFKDKKSCIKEAHKVCDFDGEPSCDKLYNFDTYASTCWAVSEKIQIVK